MIPHETLRPGYDISRLILGGWQFSPGHHPEGWQMDRVLEMLVEVAEMGVTTFDCADIYEGVEELYGRFLRRWRTTSVTGPIRIHTKFVPDLHALATLTKNDVERVVDRSLRRLGVERLDLVQFFWWDDAIPGFEQAGVWLSELRDAGKIGHVAATNLNVDRCRRLADAGVDLAANQVQYSILDRRPEQTLAEYARDQQTALLCYGGLAGGFLTDRWLGRDEPEGLTLNRSLVKYRLIIDELGGWATYQRLLGTLRGIADTHGVDIAAVAVRFVLDQPGVAAGITGASAARQVARTMQAFEVELNPEEHARIRAAAGGGYGPPGEVYQLESDRTGRHGRIMKYGLQGEGGAEGVVPG